MIKLRAAAFFLSAVVACAFFAAPKSAVAAADTIASAEIVSEVYSGRVLYGDNISSPLPMASTTKILTAIIIIEDCDIYETVKIPAEAAGVEGSSVYLKAGDEYTIEELLYGLMLRSGNDCAVALAIAHSGSVKEFVSVMNSRAEKIGAVDSHFSNPSGLPSAEHYTTAHDLSIIASYALKNDVFAKIVSTKYFAPCGWKNKNKMLYNYSGANGVKTGYTVKAGRCLVTSAQRENMWLVCVVLNCPDMYERSASLLNDAFGNFSYECVYEELAENVPSSVKGKNVTVGENKKFFYPLREEERSLISVEKTLPEKLCLPVKKGERVGNIKIYFANQLIFSENLCSILDVDKSYSDILKEIAERAIRK